MSHHRSHLSIVRRRRPSSCKRIAISNLLYSLSIGITVVLFADLASATWTQDKFFLGAWDGSCVDDDAPYGDEAGIIANGNRMALLKNLYLDFGTLTEEGSDTFNQVYFYDLAYRLKVADAVSRMTEGDMRTFVPAGNVPFWWNLDWDPVLAGEIISEVSATGLTAGERNALLGYLIADEPGPHLPDPEKPEEQRQLNFVKNWIEKVKTTDPSKLAFFAISGIGPGEPTSEYEDALDLWFDDPEPNRRADVVSFDHFPFNDPNPQNCYSPGYNRKYFLNLSLARKEAAERPVWVFVMTQAWQYVQLVHTPGECDCCYAKPPFQCGCTPVTRTVPQPTPAELRLQIYSPLAYGVKGLFYWNYLHLPGDSDEIVPEPARLVANCDGFVDEPNELNYLEVQKNNRFIAELLGPIIMSSKLFGTYHQSNSQTGALPGSEIPSDEMMSSSPPVLQSMQANFVAGLFVDPVDTDIEYVLAVNKRATTQSASVLLRLKGDYRDKVKVAPAPTDDDPEPDFPEGYATTIYDEQTGITTVGGVGEILAKGGEARLFKLFKDGVPPGTAALLTSEQCMTVTLSWTAPGDDGPYGPAVASWEIRRSSLQLTDANFANAELAASGSGATPGTGQNAIIDACTDPMYYAIRFTDSAGNVSLVSGNTGQIVGTCAGTWQCMPPKASSRDLPAILALDASGPNPASTQASFRLSIPESHDAQSYRIEVFDLAGHRVRELETGHAIPGRRDFRWDLRDSRDNPVANGIYYVQLDFGSNKLVRKITVVR